MNDDDAAAFKSVIAMALEGTTCRTVSQKYYEMMSDTIRTSDPATWTAYTELFTRIRTMYRSFDDHERIAYLVPIIKTHDIKTDELLDGDCSICLRPLRGPSKIVRVRAAAPCGPETCGHFFHSWCLGAMEIHNAVGKCPVCRAQLDPILQYWYDHESTPPRF